MADDSTATVVDTLEANKNINEAEDKRQEEAAEEAAFRMGLPEVYLSSLLSAESGEEEDDNDEVRCFEAEQLSSFLETFEIEAKTDEIAELLQKHEVLQMMFEELVPVRVPYKSFWERYFFHCDPVRIQRAWEFQQELDNRFLETKMRGLREIVALPSRVVNEVLIQPVFFLTRRVVSSLSVVSAMTGLQTKSNLEQQQQHSSQKQIEELQMEINTSNERISSLRQNLGVARRELKLKEYASRSLAAELAAIKAALSEQGHKAETLVNEIREISIITADDTSNTATCTEMSGLEEEDTPPLLETSLASNCQSDETLRKSTEQVRSTIILEGVCTDDSEDSSSSSEDGRKHDEQYYTSDLVLLMM